MSTRVHNEFTECLQESRPRIPTKKSIKIRMFLEFIFFGVGSVHPVSGRCFPTSLKVLDQHTTYRGTAIPFLARVDCKIKISNANFTSEIRKTIVLGIFLMK
jgi:hypothetical protein